MKNLFLSSLLAVTALGLSSCCCMFSGLGREAKYETAKLEACGYDTVTKEVEVSSKDAKGGMLTETVTERVPRYKTVKTKVKEQCVRKWCPNNGPCGTTSETVMNMSTSQGPTGSPHIGRVITMKNLAE